MIRPIIRDPVFLSLPSCPASIKDLPVAKDLADTLTAHKDHCAGMAANMIGSRIRMIAVVRGPAVVVMLNPRILSRSGEYETEEGCLSLEGVKKAKRYRTIRLMWQDTALKTHTETLTGFPAQIVQHETDHCNGILI